MAPLLREFVRRFGPPEQARLHFQAARLEVLKGLRAVLDARIEQVGKRDRKGHAIKIE
jgi:hypothetical protein